MSDMQHIESHTPDLTEENVDKLAALFPDVLTEITDPQTGETKRAIDFDALRDKLGDVAEGTRERYQFTWPGKRAAKAEARKPISKTLRPVKERSKNWDTTQNLYIEGDNLDALKILRETYAGKIKLIYIDPPYNTGHDFIYKDNYGKTIAEDKTENGDWDDEGGQLVANPESNGRFHSDWCSMIYPRLLLARDLLKSDGAIFISIDDNEVTNLRKICDEIYGADNLIAEIPRQSRISVQNDTDLSSSHEYVVAYAKIRRMQNRRLKEGNEKQWLSETSFACWPKELDPERYSNPDNDSRGPWKADPFDAPNVRPNLTYPISNPITHETYMPPKGRCWRTMPNQYAALLADNRIVFGKDGKGRPQLKVFYNEKKRFGEVDNTWWDASRVSVNTLASKDLMQLFDGNKVFDTPKPVSLITNIMRLAMSPSSDDIVLDFYSGSAVTAEAVMQMNALDGGSRKSIMVQLPEPTAKNNEARDLGYETICEIGEERIRRAGEKIKAEIEAENAQGKLDGEVKQVPDIGFRVLRVDSSSYEDVRKTPAEFSQGALDLDEDNTKEGRSSLDLLFECLPTFQLPYTSNIEILSGEPFDGYTVYSVNGGQLLACFDADIPESLIRGMAGFEPKPSYVVVAEKSLPDSAARTNFAEIFKQSANALEGQTQIRII